MTVHQLGEAATQALTLEALRELAKSCRSDKSLIPEFSEACKATVTADRTLWQDVVNVIHGLMDHHDDLDRDNLPPALKGARRLVYQGEPRKTKRSASADKRRASRRAMEKRTRKAGRGK